MYKYYVVLPAIAACLLALDGIYLSLLGRNFATMISAIQGKPLTINYLGMAACYLILVSGLYYFIILPKRPPLDAFWLGIFVYGVYDTTNLATFAKWRPELAVVDTLWGGILFASTTYIISALLRGD